MKKFVFKFILIFIFVSIFFSIFISKSCENLFRSEYGIWKYVKSEKISKIDTLLIGDSKLMCGVSPKDLSVHSIMFSLPAMTPIEAYYILKKRISNNQIPKKLVLSFSIYNFENQRDLINSTIKFKLFKTSEIFDILNSYYKNSENYMNRESNFENLKFYIDSFLTQINFFPYYRNSLYSSNFENRNHSINEVYNITKSRLGNYFINIPKDITKQIKESINKEFKPLKTTIFYFEKILKLCKKNNIKLFYLNMPFRKSYKERINEDYLFEFRDFIMRYRYKNLIFYINNFSYLNDELFLDNRHLNPIGNRIFTSAIKPLFKQQ